MPRFLYIENPITLKAKVDTRKPYGFTPNQFKKEFHGDKEFYLPTVCRVDKKGEEPYWLGRKEWDTVIKQDEVCSFIVYPRAEGAAAIWISLAISIVIGVGTYLLTPRPNLNYNQIDKGASPTYDLTQQGNRVRLNQPIPIQYGRIRAYPDVASNAYTLNDGNNNRIFHTLLNMGWGHIEIEDMRIDDTDLSTLPFVTTNIRYEDDPATSIFPRPMVTAKEVKNVIIEPNTNCYVLNDYLSLVKYLSFDFVAPEGLYATNITVNNKPNAKVAVHFNIDISAPLNGGFFNGVSLGVGDLWLLWGQTNPAENGLYVFDTPTTPTVRHATMDSASEFTSAVVLINGGDIYYNGQSFMQANTITTVGTDPVSFAFFDPSATFYTHSIHIDVAVQEIDSDGADVGSVIHNSYIMTRGSSRPYYKTFEYTHPTEGIFKVAANYSVAPKNSGLETFTNYENYRDKLEWIGLRGSPDSYELNQPNMTMIEIAAQASGKLNDSNIGIFNMKGIRHLWVYDFDALTWTFQATTEPVWAFFDMLTCQREKVNQEGYRYSSQLDENFIDMENLQDILDQTLGEGFECNCRFDTSLPLKEALNQIGQSMRCVVYERGGKYLLAHDRFQLTLQGFFTRTNADSFEIDYFTKSEFSPTFYRVTYFDEATSKKETVDCILAGENSNESYPDYAIPEEIELHTITNRLQAWRYGIYLCAQNRYHSEKVTFESDMEGFLPNPMDHIAICHPLLTDNQHGYVQKVDGSTVYLSEPVAFNGYSSGLISFKRKNGTVAGPYVCSQLEHPYKVEMIALSTNALDYSLFSFYTEEDQNDFDATEYTFGVNKSSEVLVVSKILPTGINSCNIEGVIRNKLVYTADFPIHLMPDYDTDTTITAWNAFVLEPTECKCVVATKTITTKWYGLGYKEYKVKYLYNDGSEHLDTFTVTQLAGSVKQLHTHSYTYSYSTTIPCRVTISPVIDYTFDPPFSFETGILLEVIGIQLL